MAVIPSLRIDLEWVHRKAYLRWIAEEYLKRAGLDHFVKVGEIRRVALREIYVGVLVYPDLKRPADPELPPRLLDILLTRVGVGNRIASGIGISPVSIKGDYDPIPTPELLAHYEYWASRTADSYTPSGRADQSGDCDSSRHFSSHGEDLD